jgi:nucleotide-binding universal stress UspA family protein
MIVQCRMCRCNVPRTAAVEVGSGEAVEYYCSLRCLALADREREQSPALAPAPALPRRILVAVDGSGPSVRAAATAASLAKVFGASVELLHAIDPSLLRMLPLDAALAGAEILGMSLEQIQRQLRDEAEVQLEPCRRACEAAGVPATIRIVIEARSRAIAEAAEKADLLVIGSRGLGALSGAALGSLSHRLIGETEKPLLVVH